MFVSWPGQAARLSHACPALPAAEPQTRPSASSHTLAHSFPLCSPERGHVHPTPFHRKGRQRRFRNEHARGRQPRSHSTQVLSQEMSRDIDAPPSLTPKRWPCTVEKSGQGNGPRVIRNVDLKEKMLTTRAATRRATRLCGGLDRRLVRDPTPHGTRELLLKGRLPAGGA